MIVEREYDRVTNEYDSETKYDSDSLLGQLEHAVALLTFRENQLIRILDKVKVILLDNANEELVAIKRIIEELLETSKDMKNKLNYHAKEVKELLVDYLEKDIYDEKMQVVIEGMNLVNDFSQKIALYDKDVNYIESQNLEDELRRIKTEFIQKTRLWPLDLAHDIGNIIETCNLLELTIFNINIDGIVSEKENKELNEEIENIKEKMHDCEEKYEAVASSEKANKEELAKIKEEYLALYTKFNTLLELVEKVSTDESRELPEQLAMIKHKFDEFFEKCGKLTFEGASDVQSAILETVELKKMIENMKTKYEGSIDHLIELYSKYEEKIPQEVTNYDYKTMILQKIKLFLMYGCASELTIRHLNLEPREDINPEIKEALNNLSLSVIKTPVDLFNESDLQYVSNMFMTLLFIHKDEAIGKINQFSESLIERNNENVI